MTASMIRAATSLSTTTSRLDHNCSRCGSANAYGVNPNGSNACGLAMIALSDQGLAYLAIAATAIPHSGRGQWLQHVARKLDKRPGARYTAAWRARAKAGRIQLKLE